ncbi:hypothetical protein SAMN05444397_109154 [Flavobacterium aquidurense]|jgi:hypothetical protein|nr:hypothetical protein SAMN05444397_109154 [Flavobacterium aquidurense]
MRYTYDEYIILIKLLEGISTFRVLIINLKREKL